MKGVISYTDGTRGVSKLISWFIKSLVAAIIESQIKNKRTLKIKEKRTFVPSSSFEHKEPIKYIKDNAPIFIMSKSTAKYVAQPFMV